MDSALIGLAGIVVGALLGGVGKYWSLRRDAWRDARRSGLLLLADVRAVRSAPNVGSGAHLAITRWQAERATLAGFRRGSYPNGLKADEWLELADRFARLDHLVGAQEAHPDNGQWDTVLDELQATEKLLASFKEDPPVLRYAMSSGLKNALGRGGSR